MLYYIWYLLLLQVIWHSPGKRVCCKINAFGSEKPERWFRRITCLAASVYSDAFAIRRCRILNQIFLHHIGVGTAGQQYYHRRGQVRDFWTHRIFRRIATSKDSRWGLRDYRFYQWSVSAV